MNWFSELVLYGFVAAFVGFLPWLLIAVVRDAAGFVKEWREFKDWKRHKLMEERDRAANEEKERRMRDGA